MKDGLKAIEERVRQHFADDDLSPSIVRELATVVAAVVAEQLEQSDCAVVIVKGPSRRRQSPRKAKQARKS